MAATLNISDGTKTISLIGGEDGFYLNAWRPAIAQYKGGGVYQSSPLSDGRQMVTRQFDNIIERLDLKVATDSGQDTLAVETQELRRLLEKAVAYWTTDWQNEPVWIEAQSSCETNMRYALIHSYSTPDDDNPYAAPFLQEKGGAAMNNWTLILEHSHWQSTEPGTGDCVEITGAQECPPALEFGEGGSGVANCGDNAALEDLHDAAFTIDGWVRCDRSGEAWSAFANTSLSVIMTKGNGSSDDPIGAGSGWWLGTIDLPGAQSGLYALINCATTDAISCSGADDFTWDGDWHHIAMTFNDAGDRKIYFFIDGVACPDYDGQSAGTGAIVSDAGYDLCIGSHADGSFAFQGAIGWMRISNSVRWAGGFNVPTRCRPPVDDANTVAIWIYEGVGDALDNLEGTAALDGTVDGAVWSRDCDDDCLIGRADTCENEVYWANKQNRAQITDIYIQSFWIAWDTTNYALATPPFRLWQAHPDLLDAVYFGSDTTTLDSGPFCSLVFDIGTAQELTPAEWQYFDGANWVALDVQDNTNAAGEMTGEPFDTTGVASVHWNQPDDWATRDLSADGGPAVTGYWVRCQVTAGVAGAAAPIQINRVPYTITWGNIDVEDTDVLGDIAALAETKIYNWSDGTDTAYLHVERTVMGLRSVTRGENFSAYLNCSDEQNPPGLTVTCPGAASDFQDDPEAPTGRSVLFDPGGVVALSVQIAFEFDRDLAPQYMGQYRAFLRLQPSGTSSTVTSRLTISSNVTTGYLWHGEEVIVNINTDPFSIYDMGTIEFPPNASVFGTGDEMYQMYLIVDLGAAGDIPVTIYDVILIPIDEWAGDFESLYGQTGGGGSSTDWLYLDIDSICHPKRDIRAILREYVTDGVVSPWRPVTNGPLILQANTDQRLWMLSMNEPIGGPPGWKGDPAIAGSMQVYKAQRYFSLRGER